MNITPFVSLLLLETLAWVLLFLVSGGFALYRPTARVLYCVACLVTACTSGWMAVSLLNPHDPLAVVIVCYILTHIAWAAERSIVLWTQR